MAKYNLTAKAVQDLNDIWNYTFDQWHFNLIQNSTFNIYNFLISQYSVLNTQY